jgi:hypothetical protein
MDMQTLPPIIRDLFAEVSMMDEEAFPPTMPVETGEKVLGTITDPWTRKLWATCQMHKRESDRARVECQYADHSGGKNCPHAYALNSHQYRAEICGKMFWTICNDTFNQWGNGGSVGLRKGWVLVFDEDDDGGPNFEVLGGGNLPDGLLKALRRRLKGK